MRQLFLLCFLLSLFACIPSKAQDTSAKGRSYITWSFYPITSPNGHPLSKTHYARYKGTYFVENKWIYTYDAKGNLSTLVYQAQNSDGQFKNDDKYIYSYYNNGFSEIIIHQTVAWDGSWQNARKDSLVTDAHHNWIYYQGQSWQNGKWLDPTGIEQIKYNYGQDGHIIYLIWQKKHYATQDWLTEYKDSCILDNNGQIKTRLTYYNSGSDVYSTLYYYLHLQHNDISQVLCDSAKEYDSTGSHYRRDSSTYTQDGKPLNTSTMSADSNGINYIQEKNYKYNDHGDQVEFVWQYGTLAQLDTVNHDVDTLSYDPLGRKTVDEQYSLAGEKVTIASKDVWDYGNDGLDEQVSSNKDLVVYPNPTSGNIHLQFNEAPSRATQIELYDIQGRKVQTWPGACIQQGTMNISLDGLPTGMYYLKAGAQTCRIVKSQE